MPLSEVVGAYNDCFDYFEKALGDPAGIRVKFNSREEAYTFQIRMNYARTLQRRDSRRLYEPKDPRWGTSEFDHLVVRSPREDSEGMWWIYIEHQGRNVLAVESLSDIENIMEQ